MAERLFHDHESIGVAPRFDLDQPARGNTRAGKARREKVRALHDPQDIALRGAGRDPGREQGGGSIVAQGSRFSGDLVQG